MVGMCNEKGGGWFAPLFFLFSYIFISFVIWDNSICFQKVRHVVGMLRRNPYSNFRKFHENVYCIHLPKIHISAINPKMRGFCKENILFDLFRWFSNINYFISSFWMVFTEAKLRQLFSVPRGGTTWTGDFTCREIKSGFRRKRWMQTVLLGLSLVGNLIKPLLSGQDSMTGKFKV